jgi:hypothetical protein
MGTYAMLTRLSPEALKNPESVTRLNKWKTASRKIALA